MCGIFCLINCAKHDKNLSINHESREWSLCKDVISARGPDGLNSLTQGLSEWWHGQFYASILWMQGAKPISQPLVDNDSNILLWNGDVFSGDLFQEGICDSEQVLSKLSITNDIYSILKNIKGPFSIIYYQSSSNLLYFARDKFGRHSLLSKITENSLFLTSVAVKSLENIIELPAVGLYVADLNEKKIKIKCLPWNKPNKRLINIINSFKENYNVDITVEIPYSVLLVENSVIDSSSTSKMGFLKYLDYFEDSNKFDEIMEYFLKQKDINQIVNDLLKLLNESVRRRVKIIPDLCRNCTKLIYTNVAKCQHTKVGILYSGGLDSAILAAIAHNHVPVDETIDLINVAFEKKNNANYEVPDRKTGRQTFNELLKICSNRKFNLIEVNVSQEELQRKRSTKISDLVYPHATILDDSLACAVWFASRAKGKINLENQSYESTCRVLLLGMGADEQFGGYMRHRTILKRNGWDAVKEELQLEFDRISERNLGRDDRMVADHGRQSRLPYLDEDFVDYVQQLLPWERCCPTEKFPPGLGDKLILRLVARKIKLHEAAKLLKRAFQFGSRIADGKENAKDISKRL
ncbi:asparagine synthetase domain-containing protein 1 [Phymastichus coffea]|uniref:asparagine synthetase domain-containing protein 1 n=1 Tax=Phymastichus coffea TaxID=108790 RepID=UPI00273B1736|nr:asparagine synthetase domain-containing protein 1 [Phymastichus coffea]